MRKSVILSGVLSVVFFLCCPVTVVFAEEEETNVAIGQIDQAEQAEQVKSDNNSDITAGPSDVQPDKVQTKKVPPPKKPSLVTAKNVEAPKTHLIIDGLVLTDAERRVYELTNAERQKRGLPALRLDRRLMESARRQANWMARTGILRHGNAPVAENIAMGQRSSREVVVDWLNSAGHFRNMMNRGYGAIGIGSFRGKNGVLYWCQQFTR